MRLVVARTNRSSVILYGHVDIRSFVVKVRVRDLSPDGALIDLPAKLVGGDRFNFTCNGTGPVAATIAWVRGNRCGITFDEHSLASA